MRAAPGSSRRRPHITYHVSRRQSSPSHFPSQEQSPTMSRKHVFAVAATALALAACDGFKEAISAHVEVVARAGSQELSVRRLADLLGTAKDAPVNRDAARVVAEYWVSYQLLAEAAAKGDSFNKPEIVDSAMWAAIANAKVNAWYEVVSKTFPGVDSAAFES